jgi:hypothetical protein
MSVESKHRRPERVTAEDEGMASVTAMVLAVVALKVDLSVIVADFVSQVQ